MNGVQFKTLLLLELTIPYSLVIKALKQKYLKYAN